MRARFQPDSGPDAVALDASAGKVFVANSEGTLTVIPTSTCNQTTTSGCGTPAQIASAGHLSAPDALAVNGSTLYVGNTNGTVAVYNATTNAWVATVNLLSSSLPTALAVDTTHATRVRRRRQQQEPDRVHQHGELQRHHDHGVLGDPSTVSGVLGHDPVGLAVAGAAGDLYVANAGPAVGSPSSA